MSEYSIGSIVKIRGREWVVTPSDDKEVSNLRPISGGEGESCSVFLPIEGRDLQAANFPVPGPGDMGDHQGSRLLATAARLLIRYGAGPFRSFGYLGFRPRPYQLVPLLMALRLDTVRLMIADDVGVGKTIEAGLIARELLDRGEVRRIAVVCPPYLCDQWQDELASKFNIDAVVIRAESFARLERQRARPDLTVFQYYPHLIVSVDFVKSDRMRFRFLEGCPDLVIVDEAHGCARPAGAHVSQQQRHDLVNEIAKKTDRHLLLVTATPHSGISDSFSSLIGLMKPEFGALDLDRADGKEQLARHFVQRRRGDIEKWLGETQFPRRESSEESYTLSAGYLKLFDDVYDFARGLVRTEEGSSQTRQRVRYWAALALLRSVMSSPAAAVKAFEARRKRLSEDGETDEGVLSSSVMDSIEGESAVDLLPTHAIDTGEATFSEGEKRRLREFEKQAASLHGETDAKLKKAEELVRGLLKEGLQPILFCRFIDTAEYVARELDERLHKAFPEVRVISVTGNDPEDERKTKIVELCQSPRRVLVATDCLSEGVNLQDGFNAVIHYDLPWNPNRLDQREGRVDRFGQTAKVVKAMLLYGSNNVIDGKVFEVLIRKAREIRSKLGIMVPLPVDSDTVMASVLKALFWEKGAQQLQLFQVDAVSKAHSEWDRAAERQDKIRTIFAQTSIKPDEVARELKLSDAVLGDNPEAVKDFVENACQRLGSRLEQRKAIWTLDLEPLPETVRSRGGARSPMKLVFDQPVPEGASLVTRNHPLVEALGEYVFDRAFDPTASHDLVSRAGVVVSKDVTTTTTLFILRLRFSLRSTDTGALSMAEECLLTGFTGSVESATWFDATEANRLLKEVKACGDLTPEEKTARLQATIASLNGCRAKFETLAKERAAALQDSYDRLRKTIKGSRTAVTRLLPVDVLAIVVFVAGS